MATEGKLDETHFNTERLSTMWSELCDRDVTLPPRVGARDVA